MRYLMFTGGKAWYDTFDKNWLLEDKPKSSNLTLDTLKIKETKILSCWCGSEEEGFGEGGEVVMLSISTIHVWMIFEHKGYLFKQKKWAKNFFLSFPSQFSVVHLLKRERGKTLITDDILSFPGINFENVVLCSPVHIVF